MPNSPAPSTPPSPRRSPASNPDGPEPTSMRNAGACSTSSVPGSITKPTSARPSPSRRARKGSRTSASARSASTFASTELTASTMPQRHAKGDSGQTLSKITLDYKPGEAQPSDGLGDRPDEPQLPLYAVVSRTPH